MVNHCSFDKIVTESPTTFRRPVNRGLTTPGETGGDVRVNGVAGMFARVITAVRSFSGPVLRDRRGAAAVFLAVALIPMVGAVGLAVDSSIGYLLKTRMGKALDTAGLAAGRVALDGNAEEVAQQFFDANFGTSNDTVTVEPVDFELDDTMRFVTLSTTATTPTRFMRVFGHDTMTVSARSVIQRETTGMELALVLDNTGSMWGSAYTAMYNASVDLVDILYGDENEIDNLWVSVVPYVATVNIGPTRTGWLTSTDRVITGVSNFPAASPWKGCVMAQAYPRDTNDDPPSVQKLTSYYYATTTSTADNKWTPIVTSIADRNLGVDADRNTARGPNLGCGSPITPLTQSKATITAALAAMGPVHRGGTTGNFGLTWGWRTLSPRWRGLWGDPDLPLDYHTQFMEKVVVLMSDGNNQFHDQDTSTSNNSVPASDFTAFGRIETLIGGSTGTPAQRRSAGRAILDARQTETCTAMKAEGIRIYTIIFGAAPDATAQNLFRNCATTPAMYYYAPTNAALASAFRAIGGQLANLRIVE